MESNVRGERTWLDDGYWRRPLEEGYWSALLSQGEITQSITPVVDPPGVDVEPVVELSPAGSALVESDGCGEGDMWQMAHLALDRGDLFALTVSGANRGGLLVEWNGLPGFVPASHLKVMPRQLEQHERMSELAGRVGDSLTVRLIEVDSQQKRLVFSERAAWSGSHPASSILSGLSVGDVRQGTITNVTSFGAFVDLGGIEGLVHISEISWDRVHHPSDLLTPGQQVEVYVMGVNSDQERIALSLKRLRPNPWSLVDTNYQVGQIVEGTVTNVVNFGVFVRIEEGLEGLIHISELAEGNFLHPRNVVREGDVVKVRVLNIDTANRRLGLSLRQAYGAAFGI
jgi:small subunit ribosomal protein S1